jgi:hypothetical protein
MRGGTPLPADFQLVMMHSLLHKVLSCYGFNTTLVLWVMWLLSCYISGSAVLAIMHGRSFVPNDLDFYVPARSWFLLRLFLWFHPDLYLVDDPRSLGKKPLPSHYPLPGIQSIHYYHNRKTNMITNVIVTTTQ